jgi:hypothetical protein
MTVKEKSKWIFILFSSLLFLFACSHKINPEKPFLSATDFKLDSLPLSEINVPVQVNLKPLYELAEKNLDTVFTSPHYPDDWVQEACDIRYKYSFRRGPLQMKAWANSISLGFTGYYKIIGSSRVCLNGIAVSPWTPPCKCGFEEERKVNVSFEAVFSLLPDYKMKLSIKRLEPQPLNKCEVCFWGQDITTQVMNGLKTELDAAKANIEKTYSMIDLKPYFQQAWDQLKKVYPVSEYGWLQINPQKLRINNLFARNDTLNIFMGLSAKPVISFERPAEQQSFVPPLGDFSTHTGFEIFTDAVLHYDSLSRLINLQLAEKQIDLDKGPVKRKFIFREALLFGAGNEKMIIKIRFGGSAEGIVYLTGKPAYDPKNHIVEVKDLDFDVKSKDKMLRTAEWLFNKKILNTISEYAKFDLTTYLDSARFNLTRLLNAEWVKGIRSTGNISDVNLVGIYPLNNFLVIRSSCTGLLFINAESLDFSF